MRRQPPTFNKKNTSAGELVQSTTHCRDWYVLKPILFTTGFPVFPLLRRLFFSSHLLHVGFNKFVSFMCHDLHFKYFRSWGSLYLYPTSLLLVILRETDRCKLLVNFAKSWHCNPYTLLTY